jgi:hypothetical protein
MFSCKKIQRRPHRAYSLELTSSNFFLFGYIKRKLSECSIRNRQSLKRAMIHIFGEVAQETLMAVFRTWLNRLEWVTEHEAEDFHQ